MLFAGDIEYSDGEGEPAPAADNADAARDAVVAPLQAGASGDVAAGAGGEHPRRRGRGWTRGVRLTPVHKARIAAGMLRKSAAKVAKKTVMDAGAEVAINAFPVGRVDSSMSQFRKKQIATTTVDGDVLATHMNVRKSAGSTRDCGLFSYIYAQARAAGRFLRGDSVEPDQADAALFFTFWMTRTCGLGKTVPVRTIARPHAKWLKC